MYLDIIQPLIIILEIFVFVNLMYMHAKTYGQYNDVSVHESQRTVVPCIIIVIAMVFVFSSYIREFTCCFQFSSRFDF